MRALLFPKIRADWFLAMLGYCLMGALLAGLYGVFHDQITYSISPEYFTRLKFAQFHYADFGLPPRIFVGEIGFLASWWVGFIAAWFLARIAVPAFPPRLAFRYILRGSLIIFSTALVASIIGYVYGLWRSSGSDFSAWQRFTSTYGVLDLPSFVRVAYIHNASYLGGLIGLVVAIAYLRRLRRKRDGAVSAGQGETDEGSEPTTT